MYRFTGFVLCPVRRVLWRDGAVIELGMRATDVLIALVAAAGESVSKEALMAAAWPGRVVEANNLTVQIAALRRTLQQRSAQDIAFIRTLSGQGYAFGAPVERTDPTPPPDTVDWVAQSSGDPAGPPAGPIEPLTPFIGRAAELAQLVKLLETKRLVSITGIGGVGKTRLALRLGHVLAADYRDGVVLVDLAPLGDPLRVAAAVNAALGASTGTRTDAAVALAVLRARRTLLILDNVEHLRDAVAELAGMILQHCPGVAILATSRETLGVAAEQVFRLQPLALPAPGEVTAATALDYDAVRLFADRAAGLIHEFELDETNASDIVAICRRVDGIALAIEMAVQRLQVLTPRQLLDRLRDRFRLLTAGTQDVLPRQRTLRAMFDWSWEFLRPDERALMERLAVFSGSAALSALTELETGNETEWDVLDRLTSLVQKSLILVQARTGGEPRYRMLETTRQYALDRLPPQRLAALHRRHAERVAEVLEQAGAEWPRMNGTTWLNRYGPEIDNVRAALDWAFQPGASRADGTGAGDEALGLRLVAASFLLWWELPSLPLRESHRWHTLAVDRIRPDTPIAIQARLWLGLSWKDVRKGDEESYPSAERAVALFRQTDDRLGLAAALWRAASTMLHRVNLARQLLDECEEVLRSLPPTKWRALCLIRQADLAKNNDMVPEALPLYDEALALARGYGLQYGVMLGGGNRAELLYDLGRGDEAIEEFRRLRRELPPGVRYPVIALMTWHLALTDETAEALDTIREIVGGFPVTGLRGPLGRALESLALLRARAGDTAIAARLLGCGQAFHPATPPFGPRHAVVLRTRELIAASLGTANGAAMMEAGAAWSEDEALAAARNALGFQT